MRPDAVAFDLAFLTMTFVVMLMMVTISLTSSSSSSVNWNAPIVAEDRQWDRFNVDFNPYEELIWKKYYGTVPSSTTQSTSRQRREDRANVRAGGPNPVEEPPQASRNARAFRRSENPSRASAFPTAMIPTATKSAPPASTYSAKRRMARQEGDIILGALFPVHHHPPIQTAYSRVCGGIRENYGIQRIEAFQLTVDEINRNSSILPHIRLGWDIRDSCWYSAIALEQSIDFIQDAIASKTIRDGRLVSALPDEDPSSRRGQSGHQPRPAHSVDGRGRNTVSRSSSSSSPRASQEESGCAASLNKPIVGLIGPGSSEASIQVQNLMQIFNIPQIGYSATSMDLSDKNIYRYFLRVVPPDNYQVQALVDIVRAFNWTYISTVHSDGNYGIRGMEMFTDLVGSYNICIASTDSVASSDSDLEFDRVVDRLRKTPNASVVVCFCEGITVKKLLQAISRRGVDGRFLIIGSDGWGNRLDVVEGQERTASGGISIMLYSPPLPDFQAYYSALRPNGSVSRRNPWFKEFWQEKFHCYLRGDVEKVSTYREPCTGAESLENSDQDSKLGFVVNAVKTMALALHDMHSDLCPGSVGLCPEMAPINGTLFLEYLLNVSFPSYSGHDVHFDDNGDPPGRYEILNFQPVTHADGNVTYEYVAIGQWMTGNLELNDSAIYWPGKGRNPDKPFNSVCSQPCGPGFVKQGVGSDGLTCCWVCTPCQDNEIVVDEAHCSRCDLGWWPNDNKTDCEKILVEFVTWLDTWSLVVVVMACVGLTFTAWVTIIFMRSHNTPVVKASTRELSYILLLGIALAFSCNFLLVSKPAPVFCYLSRIVPGLAFSVMYGALVTRTNRIARILEGSKRIMTKKPRFMSATAQVVITTIIIGLEVVIIIAMLILEPADAQMDYSKPKRVRLVCNTSTLGIIVPLGFDLFLIFMCTLYAIKTRNLPENFNEAKFIGFTMYTTCVIWLGFFPIYFGGQNYQEVTLSISISLSAAIALVLLFFPKVYIIIWAPQKNTRGAFTTSKDVRCHIGSKSIQSSDSVEFREGRYDSVTKMDSKTPQSWKQKSLDEKRLRFVMKRTSIPASRVSSSSISSYINHGVLANHRAAAVAAPLAICSATPSASFPPSRGREKDSKPKRVSMLSDHQQQYSFGEFSDSDCLLPDSDRESSCGGVGGGGGAGAGGGAPRASSLRSRFRDSECQTGDDLVQVMFLQLRRRRFQTCPAGGNNVAPAATSPYRRPGKGSDIVKEVKFSTHVVPVHVDSAWSPPYVDRRLSAPEQQPLLGRGGTEENDSGPWADGEEDPLGAEACRRLSSVSSQSYKDGGEVSFPGTRFQDSGGILRRSSDIPDLSSHAHQHHAHSTIYHRPPTPRTPRKLLIQNNHHNDLPVAADGSLPQQTLSRDSLPSPHALRVNRTSSPASPTTPSLSSLLSQGSGMDGSAGTGRGEKDAEEVRASPSADTGHDKGVIEFQQYLLDRGLSLDLSSVQTSNL